MLDLTVIESCSLSASRISECSICRVEVYLNCRSRDSFAVRLYDYSTEFGRNLFISLEFSAKKILMYGDLFAVRVFCTLHMRIP